MKKLLALLPALLAAGCVMKPVYLNKPVFTVAILPPFNQTQQLDVDVSMKMWPHVEHEVAARGYGLVPRAAIQAFYESKRYRLPAEISQHPTEELARAFKCDGIVYSEITKWDRKTILIYTELTVAVQAAFRDGKDNAVLWTAEGSAGDSSTALDWRSAAGDTLTALIANMDRYCGPAARDCFASLPLAGFDPELKKTGQEEPK